MATFNFKSWLISTLRRASYRWPPRTEAFKAARVERGLYKCEMCTGIFPKKEIKLDHIQPVVPVTGFTTWDDFINRLFCEASGYQVICETCHSSKTAIERELRKKYRIPKPKTSKKLTVPKE